MMHLSPEEEAELRQRVEARMEARREFFGHLSSYIAVNVMLWVIYFASDAGNPWPLWVTIGWGFGMFGHAWDYWTRPCWRIELSSSEPSEGRDFCRRSLFAAEPIEHTHQVHRRRSHQVLEMDFVQTPVAGTTHPQHTNRLRNCALNSRTFLVSVLELVGLLPFSRRLQCSEFCFGNKRHLPPTFGSRAAFSNRTGTAGFSRELGLDRWFSPVTNAFFPLFGRVSLWAGHGALFKVDVEVGDIEGIRLLRLPTDIGASRTEQINLIIGMTFHESRA